MPSYNPYDEQYNGNETHEERIRRLTPSLEGIAPDPEGLTPEPENNEEGRILTLTPESERKEVKVNPYDELYRLIEAQKPKLDDQQQKRLQQHARVNAYGQGLSTIIDALGASAGANVLKRELPKTALMAYNKYYQNEDEYKSRMNGYNNLINQLKFRDAAAKDGMNKAAIRDKFDREKMIYDSKKDHLDALQKQQNWQTEQDAKENQARNKFILDRRQQENEKNKFSLEKKGKPYFQVTYDHNTIDLDQAQYNKILDIVKKVNPQLQENIDVNYMNAQMGNQNAKMALDQIVTSYWQSNSDALQEGLRSSQYGIYNTKHPLTPITPGINNPTQINNPFGGSLPFNQTQQTQPQNNAEFIKYGKKIVKDILKDSDTGKGKRIYEAMIAAGFSKEQAASQVKAMLKSNKYNLK